VYRRPIKNQQWLTHCPTILFTSKYIRYDDDFDESFNSVNLLLARMYLLEHWLNHRARWTWLPIQQLLHKTFKKVSKLFQSFIFYVKYFWKNSAVCCIKYCNKNISQLVHIKIIFQNFQLSYLWNISCKMKLQTLQWAVFEIVFYTQ